MSNEITYFKDFYLYFMKYYVLQHDCSAETNFTILQYSIFFIVIIRLNLVFMQNATENLTNIKNNNYMYILYK